MTLITHNDNCPKCASKEIELRSFSDDIEFRGFILDVENLQDLHCKSCGHSWGEKTQVQHNQEVLKIRYAAIRDKERTKQGLLGAAEIESIRNLFDLSQRDAASLFGGGYNAFNKYESGEVLQSFAMDRLLRITRAFGVNAIEFLKDVNQNTQFNVTKVNAKFSKIPNYNSYKETGQLILNSRMQAVESSAHYVNSFFSHAFLIDSKKSNPRRASLI